MPRHLITSAPSRVTEAEHLGGLAGPTLAADVHARFLRARGEQVLFVGASDEHGATVELAAREAGLDAGEHCRRQHDARARLADELGLSFDAFGRSSAARAREQTQYFAQRLDEEGFLEARSTRQPFSPRDSRQLFLLQSKLAGELRAWLNEECEWPPLARSIGLEHLDRGLEDRSVTGDLAWGAPVERQGFDEKVYCAWFDAPIACIGATREWAEANGDPDAWRQWWRASEEVRHVQFLSSADVSSHAMSFLCMVVGSGDSWKLVDHLEVFHRFALDDDGAGVSIDRALELFPADCWRYYLTANAPESEDAVFSWEGLADAVNRNLAGAFGDFVQRSLELTDRYFGGEIPAGGQPGPAELELLEDLDLLLDAYTNRMRALELRAAIGDLRAIWRRGNAYLDRKRPWASVEADRGDAELALRFCVNLACLFARLSAPVTPFAADRVLDALAAPASCRGWPSAFRGDELPAAHRFSVPPPLFRRVAAGEVAGGMRNLA